MSDIQVGSSAPDIKLQSDNGETVALNDFTGQQVVLYFYPKDDTPGCTKEAIAFTGLQSHFKDQNTVIIGVSPDGVTKHSKFKTKHDLSIMLLADEDKEAAEAFGVRVEKNMYGKKYMGVERSTFLIDASGKIAQLWRKVKVPGHAETVLDTATDLNC